MATTTPPPSVFERTLADFKANLEPHELQAFQVADLQDLKREILAIQQKQKSSRTCQAMTRLNDFLEALNSYGPVIEVFVNVHNFVAFIWGPMKFLLKLVSSFSEAFNALLNAYQRISECLPQLAQYEDLFAIDPNMRQVLGNMFQDIFEFHQRALKYFKGSAWKQVFRAAWFGSRFNDILENLRLHKTLVDSQANIVEFENAKQHRLLVESKFKDLEEQETLRRRSALAAWLSPASWQDDHDHIFSATTYRAESGQWFLSCDKVKAWLDPKVSSMPLLWITGIPGAGKTVLASLVVEKSMKIHKGHVLYFYCRFEDSQRNNFVAMACSLLSQLVRNNDDLLPFLFEEAVKSGERVLRSGTLASRLLEACLRASGKAYIIIDGLDECPETQRIRIADFLREFVDQSSTGSDPCRCITFSQDDASIRRLMSNIPTFHIAQTDNLSDIEAYCSSWSQKFRDKFSLDADKVHDIVSETVCRAKGMFLFAKLVMSNLYQQPTKAKLEYEMHPDVFPKGLNQIYDRIVKYLLEQEGHKDETRRILSWITIAMRPLRWYEIQAATSVDVHEGSVNYELHQLRVGSKELCGSLVEEHPNGTITFVHATAKQYLVSTKLVDVSKEHWDLMKLCLHYLCLPAFAHNAGDAEVDNFILSGQYAFFDYSIICWFHHLEIAMRSAGDMEEILEILDNFLELHWVEPRQPLNVPRTVTNSLQAFEGSDIRHKLEQTATVSRNTSSADLRNNLQLDALRLFKTLSRTRNRMEKLIPQPNHMVSLTRYYGSSTYKCPRLQCKWFHEGFASMQGRDSHVERHDRSFYCPEVGCLYATLGFPNEAERDSHIKERHKVPPKEDEFPAEPKIRRNAVHKHHCSICDKGYTTSSNLSVHMRTHNGAFPFKCSICNQSFQRKDACTRHETEAHSQGSRFICRGTCSSGTIWGCGKTFQRLYKLKDHLTPIPGAPCLPTGTSDQAEVKMAMSASHPDQELCNCQQVSGLHKRCQQCFEYGQSTFATFPFSRLLNVTSVPGASLAPQSVKRSKY